MTTWTSPRTWSVGDVVTATFLNQFLRDDINVLAAVTQDATLVDLVSSVTETDLVGTQGSGVSIPGGTLKAASLLRITVLGDVLNNTGGAQTCTIKLYWGGNLATGGALNLGASTTRFPIYGEFFVAAENATNQAALLGYVMSIGANTVNLSQPLPALNTTRAWSDFTVDGTVAQALRLTATLGASNASLEFRKRITVVEMVGNA